MVAGVEQLVRDPAAGEHTAEQFGDLDGDRADQHGQIEFVQAVNLLDDGVVFLAFGAVDLVLLVETPDGAVGRYDAHIEFVDLPELSGLRFGGAGHTGELAIHPEEVLDSDCGHGLGLVLQLDAFLGLEGLMQAVGKTAPGLRPARGLVDDDDASVIGDEVLHVLLEKGVRLHQLVDIVHRLVLLGVVAVRLFLLARLVLFAQRIVAADFVDEYADIGQHEERLLVG